jgi:hypothetical protein
MASLPKPILHAQKGTSRHRFSSRKFAETKVPNRKFRRTANWQAGLIRRLFQLAAATTLPAIRKLPGVR